MGLGIFRHPGLVRCPRAGVCSGSPCAAQGRRRGGTSQVVRARVHGEESDRKDVEACRPRPSAPRTSRRRPQYPQGVERHPEAFLRDHISLRLHMHSRGRVRLAGAGAGAIDCCPSSRRSTTGRLDASWRTKMGRPERGSWVFPFVWGVDCFGQPWCLLLLERKRKEGRGQGPDGDFALLCQILVDLLPVGGGVENHNRPTTTLIQRRHRPSSLFHLHAQLHLDREAKHLAQKSTPIDDMRARYLERHDALPRLRPRPSFLLRRGTPLPFRRRHDGDSRSAPVTPSGTRTLTHTPPSRPSPAAGGSISTHGEIGLLACMAMRAPSPPPPPPPLPPPRPQPCPRCEPDPAG